MDALTHTEQRAVGREQFLEQLVNIIAADEMMLGETVGAGPVAWRNSFYLPRLGDAAFDFRAARIHFRLTDDDLDRAFYALSKAVVFRHGLTAGQLLDNLVVAPAGPTQAEIDASWEVVSESTDEAKQALYGRLHPQEYLDKLNAGAQPHEIVT